MMDNPLGKRCGCPVGMYGPDGPCFACARGKVTLNVGGKSITDLLLFARHWF